MANLQVAKQKAAQADAAQNTGGLMTRKVDAAAKAMMAHKVNPNQSWQVVFIGDRSYSMLAEYESGSMQEVSERSLGFATIVDDDGTVPAIFFDRDIEDFEIKLDDFHGFLERHNITARGTTNLTGALVRLAEITGNGDLFSSTGGFFHRSASAPKVVKSTIPVFAIVVTDGLPNDPESAADAIRRLSYRGIFFKFLYTGHDARGWDFLDRLDNDLPVGVPFDKGGRLVDNVNAQRCDKLHGMSDEDFYAHIFEETPEYLPAARAVGVI